MFRQPVDLKPLSKCFLNDIFQRARSVFTKLSRVGMMTVHNDVRLLNWGRIGVTVTEELFGSGQKLDLKLIISSYLIISVDEST